MNLQLTPDSITVIAISIDIQFGVGIGLGNSAVSTVIDVLYCIVTETGFQNNLSTRQLKGRVQERPLDFLAILKVFKNS